MAQPDQIRPTNLRGVARVKIVCPSCGRQSMGEFMLHPDYDAVVPTERAEQVATLGWQSERRDFRLVLECHRRAKCGRRIDVNASRFALQFREAVAAGSATMTPR